MAIARTIPEGRVTTFAAIGDYLDVMARHVAYLLAQRNDEEREAVPWHRVVGSGGALGTPKRDFHGESQADLLAAEGVEVGPGMKVVRFDDLFFPITLESTGVVPTPRDPTAPTQPTRPRRLPLSDSGATQTAHASHGVREEIGAGAENPCKSLMFRKGLPDSPRRNAAFSR